MSAEPNQPRLSDKLETQSSLYQKLPPSLRRQVDRAIVDHDPPTYRAVFDKFKLAAYAVSFTAFYRYAHRLRTNAALTELAALTLPEGKSVDEFLPELVGQRFLEAALEEETTPSELLRLANAHRIAIQNHIASHHFAAAAPNRARAEASGSIEASDASPAPGTDDDNLHLLENYIAALERDTKAREQAAQAEIQAIEQTVAALSPASIPPRNPQSPIYNPQSPAPHKHLQTCDRTPATAVRPSASSFPSFPSLSLLPSSASVVPSPLSTHHSALTTDLADPSAAAPTSLSQRREDRRRQRRRERHRRRR